jgi:two-component system, chemotaxis family, chemotaxis protein CheY
VGQHRILSVGQCGFDHGSLSRFFARRFGAEVVGADTPGEALDALRSGPFDLVLVNRVSNGDGSPGLELIRAMKSDPALADSPVMLVSNYPDAQDQAVALGALRGFGKSQLNDPETIRAIESTLAPKEPS